MWYKDSYKELNLVYLFFYYLKVMCNVNILRLRVIKAEQTRLLIKLSWFKFLHPLNKLHLCF